MNKKIRTISALSITAIIAGIFLFPTVVALAQEGYKPLVTLPGIFTAGKATNPVEIIKGIYGIAIGIGSVIATVMIIWAGFEYMYQESITGKSAARERITNAFLGLLVILGSYILLRTINPALVEFSLLLPGGTGRVSGLIAVQKEFEAAQVKIREAQKEATRLSTNVQEANTRLTTLENKLTELRGAQDQTESTEEQASIQAEIDALTAEKETVTTQRNAWALEEKYVRATGGLDLNISSMEESIFNGDGVNNVPGNITRGLNNILEAKKALQAEYDRTKSPTIGSKLSDIEKEEIFFRANAAQLNLIYNWKQKDGPQPTPADMKRIESEAVTELTKRGSPELVKRLQESTARRAKLVCTTTDCK